MKAYVVAERQDCRSYWLKIRGRYATYQIENKVNVQSCYEKQFIGDLIVPDKSKIFGVRKGNARILDVD